MSSLASHNTTGRLTTLAINKIVEKRIDRREFLGLSGKLFASAVAGSVADRLSRFLPEEAVQSPEAITGPQMHELLTNRDFLLQARSPRSFFTRQTDPTEYNPTRSNSMNACGQALIATVLKIYTYFKYGTIPDISIQTVRNDLESRTYLGNGQQQSYFERNMRMKFSAVKAALDLYAPTTHSYETIAFSDIPITGYSADQIIAAVPLSGEQINSLIDQSQEFIADGGTLAIFSTTYGGHLFLVSKLYRENNALPSFVVDSLGPYPAFAGLVRNMPLDSFVGNYQGILGLISAFGICPTYT